MKGLILFVDDWQGLFINGRLITEDHRLEDPQEWIDLTNRYGLRTIVYKEVENEEDSEYLYINGSFPKTLTELKGDYTP